MNEEEVRQLAKNILSEQMSEEIKKHLDSAIIFKYINDIENHLQSYKDKEKEIREYMNGKSFEQAFENDNSMKSVERHILQILNEGWKE